MERKIKLLAIGDQVTKTGFSRVLESILVNLPKEEYEIVAMGINYYGDPHNLPYKIYPAAAYGDFSGMNRLPDILNIVEPDIIFMLNDVWALDNYLRALKDLYKVKRPKIVTYFPVDARDHLTDWYGAFDIVDEPVVYTEFGKSVATKACPNREFRIIPHGVNTELFYKFTESRDEIKKRVFPKKPEFYDNSFIVFNGNRNQPRKRLDISMRAFKLFAEDKPDNVKLYMHCGVVDDSINIIEMGKRLGIEKRLIITSLSKGPQQIPEEKLNLRYNATDVGINSSLGEGWGLVNCEHAVTGAPQIVPANSANLELFHDCGLLVPTITDWTLDNIMCTGSLILPEDLAERIERLYVDKQLYESLSHKAMQKFTAPEYQWSNIAKTWDSLFKEVLNNDDNVPV